jgi:hypothetical protein
MIKNIKSIAIPEPVNDAWKNVSFPCIVSDGSGTYAIAKDEKSGTYLSTWNEATDSGTWKESGWKPVPKNEKVIIELQNI